jgi:hypothetical protein
VIPVVVKFVCKSAMLGTHRPPRHGGQELVPRVAKAGDHDPDASTVGDANARHHDREASEDAMWVS